jgi:transketolase
MAKDKRIWLLTGDLGFGVLDKIRDDYPDRFINCGVAEQNMVGMACGMAHSGLIPFVYSITPFLIYRAFEFIRNDVDYDKANVKIVATGRDDEYKDLGMSHCSMDEKQIMSLFPNILSFWPETKKDVIKTVKDMVRIKSPCYVNLSRFGCKG